MVLRVPGPDIRWVAELIRRPSLALALVAALGTVLVGSPVSADGGRILPTVVKPLIDSLVEHAIEVASNVLRDPQAFPVVCYWVWEPTQADVSSAPISECLFLDDARRPDGARENDATPFVIDAKPDHVFVSQFCSLGRRNVILTGRGTKSAVRIPPEIENTVAPLTDVPAEGQDVRCVSVGRLMRPDLCTCKSAKDSTEGCLTPKGEKFYCEVRGAVLED